MRFGVATADITPPFPTTMAGYGARQDSFDDVNDPLIFTALILEERGRRALLGSADLITFENDQVMPLRKKIAKAIKTPMDNVMLNASHTHGGPELRDRAAYFREGRPTGPSAQYRKWLEEQVLKTARKAAKNLQPGTLWLGEGKSTIPMNRRCERNGTIVNAPNPGGPVDNRLQVLALRDKRDVVRAVGVRLSCHPVATGAQHRITADFPGAFRAAFRNAFGPDVVPFFLQGAGGDMRPNAVADNDRWRAMKHDELPVIGGTLLAETLEVLTGLGMEKVGPLSLRGRLITAAVPCAKTNTKREQFEQLRENGSSTDRMYATEALRVLDETGQVVSEAPIRVHTLWLTKEHAMVGIQAEVLIGMGAYVEKSLAPKRTLLLGYTNGCKCYLPTGKELARGGYEASSYLYHGWSGPIKKGVERIIADAVWRG